MEANKVQCVNRHWFNAAKYDVCPHCGAKQAEAGGSIATENEISTSLNRTEEKGKKKGFFWNKNKEKNTEQEIKVTGGVSDYVSERNTIGISFGNSVTHHLTSQPEEQVINPVGYENAFYPKTEVLMKPVSATGTISNEQTAVTEEYTVKSPLPVKNEPIAAEAPRKRDIDDVKTISIYANEQGEEPVTGWLVGVAGIYRGASFSLKAGVNVIGRDAGSYVCLKKDPQVSRGKHASIIYEPKKKLFYLGEGENSLTYCNEELVCGKQELKPYDAIEIGGGKYVFVPFCGENFDWEKSE